MTYRSEGLTRSKLLFGCDDFETTDLDNFYGNDLDPEIETFQMISMMPLQFLKLNFFRKENRDIMRIVVCGEEDKPMFFEFGGHLYKNVSKFLVPRPHLHFLIFTSYSGILGANVYPQYVYCIQIVCIKMDRLLSTARMS